MEEGSQGGGREPEAQEEGFSQTFMVCPGVRVRQAGDAVTFGHK